MSNDDDNPMRFEDCWYPPHRCPCGSSEDRSNDQWIVVHTSPLADPVWMHESCMYKFERGELDTVQDDECELLRRWLEGRVRR